MMTTTETSFVLALVSPDFDSFAVRQAMAGFLAGYGDTTREAYSDIGHLGLERGHRTLTTTRKGGKIVTIRWRPVLPEPPICVSVNERTGRSC